MLIAPPSFADAGVVELRRYTLHPGGLPTLLALFDQFLITGQQEAGMLIGDLYEDIDDPGSFVWWRGFRDMEARRQALEAFYHGPVWHARRSAANATMIDSDNVLLLRHTDPRHIPPEPPPLASAAVAGIVRHDGDPATERRMSTELHPWLEDALGVPVSTWRTEPSANTFPALPVRPEPAFVWSARFPAAADREVAIDRLTADLTWLTWAAYGPTELVHLRLLQDVVD
jgi:hypothetical protein